MLPINPAIRLNSPSCVSPAYHHESEADKQQAIPFLSPPPRNAPERAYTQDVSLHDYC